MAAPATLSPRARAWLLQEVAYIAEENPEAAGRVVARFDDLLRKLGEFPNMGPPSQVSGARRFVSPPYIVTYRTRRGQVEVFAIRHGRQGDARNPARRRPA